MPCALVGMSGSLGSVEPLSLCMWSLQQGSYLHGCSRLCEQVFQETGGEGCHSFKVWFPKLALHHFCKSLLIKVVTELAQIQGVRAWIPLINRDIDPTSQWEEYHKTFAYGSF